MLTAKAGLVAARSQVVQAQSAIEAAQATVERIKADLEDSVLKAPRAGRVQYRLAEPGEVLAAGGKVVSMLDLSDVYMTVFLPETTAGRLAIGAQARLVLDVAPQYVIPAKVSFVAAEAQFTPKTVETAAERQKLVFRVKAQIDPELLRKYRTRVKAGLPGVAYVQVDPNAQWPPNLEVKLPPTMSRPSRSCAWPASACATASTVALDGIDLELPAGAMIGFIGPDGVGKSSLLALIAGARKIQQGSVHVLGGDMADARASQPTCALASRTCRRDWGRISIPPCRCSRTSTSSAGCSGSRVPSAGSASTSCCAQPASLRFPTARSASSPAA